MDSPGTRGSGDEWTERLSSLFRSHPSWLAAARHLDPEAASTVYFSHRGREPWRLDQRESKVRLVPGAASDPDLVFRFTPEAIEGLEAVDEGVGEFAVELFSLILAGKVDLRIAAGFGRLVRRGYLSLLIAAGPRVVAFGAAHSIFTLGALRRFVTGLRTHEPADWEASGPDDDPEER